MDVKDKIVKVMEVFGMNASKTSEAMNISYNTFAKNKNPKELRHNFNEKNYLDLVDFIKKEAEKLPKN